MSDDRPLLPSNASGGGEDAPNPNGLAAFEALGRFLSDDNWYPQQLPDRHIYRMTFSGKHGDFRCIAQVIVQLEQFLFYAIAGPRAPEEVRPAVAEFITRANYGMRIGNFELDYSDGEVRYKAALDFEGETLTPTLLRNHIYPVVTTMDHYLPGLMSVMFGGRTPFEAIEEIEGS